MSGVSIDARTLCITLPYAPAPSETFITNHIANLPARILTVEGWRPRIGERNVLSLPQRAVYKALRGWSGKGLERETTAAYVKAFRRHRVAAVLAEYGTTGVMAVEACRQLRIPLIVYFFGYDASMTKTLEAHAESYPRMFEAAGAIIAISRSIRSRLIRLGAPSMKVHYIPCGVDCRQFAGAAPDAAGPVFLSVGRFVDKKAPHFTLRAFAHVLARHPSATLRMVGVGPLWDDCRKLAKTLGVERAVHFAGLRTHADVRDEMGRARCFVQHSIEAASGDCEGTPLAILEAAACGLPVVSTRHAGIPDAVLDGATGFLVDEGDVDGMASHMLRLAEDPALAARLGQAARQHVRNHFSLESTISTLWEVIVSCMNGTPRTAREQ